MLHQSFLRARGISPVPAYNQTDRIVRHFRPSAEKLILEARIRHQATSDFLGNLLSHDVEDSLLAPTTM